MFETERATDKEGNVILRPLRSDVAAMGFLKQRVFVHHEPRRIPSYIATIGKELVAMEAFDPRLDGIVAADNGRLGE